MLKFEKITPRQEDGHYFNVEADFRSLQICLGFADSGFLSPLKGEPLDPVMYDIYGRLDEHGKIVGQGHQDCHAVTAFGTFYAPLKKQCYEVTDETGKVWVFEPENKLKIKRPNIEGQLEEMIILGKNIDEDDVILGLA